MTLLDDFRLFIEIANRGSYSKAADDLSMSTSRLSKRINALETHLGQTLFIRSSRGLSLTGYGRSVFEREGQSLLALHERLMNAATTLPNYFIVHCPQNLMSGPLYGALHNFLLTTEEEDINVIIEPSNTVISLSQKSFDVSIRVGPQSDSSFFHKRVATIAVAVVSMPDLRSNDTLVMPYTEIQVGSILMKQLRGTYKRIIHVHDITVARQLVLDRIGNGLLPMTEATLLNTGSSAPLKYVSGVLFERAVYAVWPGQRTPSQISQRFITCISDIVSQSPSLQGRLI